MRRTLYIAGAAALSASTVMGQGSGRAPSAAPARVWSYDYARSEDRDRAAIGVTTSSGGMRDTLGLLVQSVTAGGPADKAGIEEGNRLASINGVSLRLSAADAGEGDMAGVVNRRLVRELEKAKAGDEVELGVWAAGQTRTVKVKTVAFEDLPSRVRTARRELDERPAIGMSLSATGSRRDTLGMMVLRVTTDGPAEKAGIIEGDRIAAINGVNLRVAAEDAGDGYMSSARMNRYRRELSKVSVGEDVELRVFSGGQTKTVRVKPVKAADLPRGRGGVIIIGDDGGFGGAFGTVAPMPPMPPAAVRVPRLFEFDGNFDDGIRMRLDPQARVEIRERAEEAARRARDAAREVMERLDRLRFEVEVDGRAGDGREAIAPSPRVRSGGRIAGAGGAAGSNGSGYAYGVVSAGHPYAVAPQAWSTANRRDVTAPRAPLRGMATWSGADPTFSLMGLRLARVNDDLAESLGAGSERGFLVLDADDRWRGIRAGDVLLEIDGNAIRDGDAARIALDDTDSHTARVMRQGRVRAVAVDVQ